MTHPNLTTNAYQHTGTVNSANALHAWAISGVYKCPQDFIGNHSYATLHIDIDGQVLTVCKGDWLVREGGTLSVYKDTEFRASFISLETLDSLRGLNATDVTKAIEAACHCCEEPEGISCCEVDYMIHKIQYHHFPDTTQVVCLCTLQSGFYVTGEHSSLDHHTFNLEHAKAQALDDAKRKLKDHMAYAKRLGNPSLKLR